VRPYTPAATRYLWAVIGAGCAALLLCLWKGSRAIPAWGAFALLTLLGAVSHLYPVRTAHQKARVVVANTFVFAAVLLLDPLLLVLHCGLVMLPFTLRNRQRPRIWYGYAFNSAQTALAGLIAHQVIALNNRVPPLKTDALAPRALMAEVIQPFMGVVVAALWIAMLWVLAVLPFPVLVMYGLVRQVHLVQTVDIDSKTGLYNYKYFQQAFAEELGRSRWVKRPLSVLFADMDYLRSVNNQWGHLAGDEVLKQLAEIIRHQVRPGDMVARFGGEEFVVMLPGTDLEEAVYMAEAIRTAVAEWEFAIGGGRTIHCTISIGAACAPLHGADVNSLVEAADAALYQAKAGGRNRVARAGDSAPASEVAGKVAAAAQVTVDSSGAPPAVQAKAERRTGGWLADLLLWTVVSGAVVLLLGGLLRVGSVSPALVAALMALGVLAELAKVRVYEGGSHSVVVTLSHAVTLAAVGTPGLPAAVLTALAGAAAHDLATWKRRLPLKKRVFNLVIPVLSGGLAAILNTAIAGPEHGVSLLPLLAGAGAALAYYGLNTGGIVLMIGLLSALLSTPWVGWAPSPSSPRC
jgi:diguanylate cyclase (GGDEF)-like protein